MAKQDVRLLNAGCVGRGDAQTDVGELGQAAATLAGDSHGRDVELARAAQCSTDIAAVARCRQAYHNVARLAERLHLPLEYLFEAEVVADGGEDGDVGGEGKGIQRAAWPAEAPYEFSGQVLRVGSAAAIAAPDNLAAAQQAADQQIGGTLEGRFLRGEPADNIQMFAYAVAEDTTRVRRRRH